MINQSNDNEKLLAATAEVLRERRYELGYSQEELSQRSGLHRTYISDIELGKRNVSLLNLARIAGALGMSIAELVGKAQERAKSILAKSGVPIAPAANIQPADEQFVPGGNSAPGITYNPPLIGPSSSAFD